LVWAYSSKLIPNIIVVAKAVDFIQAAITIGAGKLYGAIVRIIIYVGSGTYVNLTCINPVASICSGSVSLKGK
jgi:hypothetical protein